MHSGEEPIPFPFVYFSLALPICSLRTFLFSSHWLSCPLSLSPFRSLRRVLIVAIPPRLLAPCFNLTVSSRSGGPVVCLAYNVRPRLAPHSRPVPPPVMYI